MFLLNEVTCRFSDVDFGIMFEVLYGSDCCMDVFNVVLCDCMFDVMLEGLLFDVLSDE